MIVFSELQIFVETTMDIVSFLFLTIIIVAILNTIYSTKYKVVNMPSAPATRRAIINDLKTIRGNCESLRIYDCGSGWGGLCRKLSKAFPKATLHGIEISPVPFLVSFLWPFRKYRVTRNDLFNTDLISADILIFYLSPYHMKKLETLLSSQDLSGKTLYSQGFPFNEWKESKIIEVPRTLEKKLYRYDF